jgi:hypothetical protein
MTDQLTKAVQLAGTHRRRFDPDEKNADRANWAETALAAFMAETGTERSDALADLLCDLMHWCDREALEFEGELRRASGHYLAETSEEG